MRFIKPILFRAATARKRIRTESESFINKFAFSGGEFLFTFFVLSKFLNKFEMQVLAYSVHCNWGLAKMLSFSLKSTKNKVYLNFTVFLQFAHLNSS
jgi:hypothetical protein